MRAVVRRTNYAYVTSEGKESGRTGPGLMVLLGVSRDDTEADAQYMADKICHLRIFEDEGGKLNRSLLDISGEMLVVSQFTLYGDVRHGRRPGFTEAAARPGQWLRRTICRSRTTNGNSHGNGCFPYGNGRYAGQ